MRLDLSLKCKVILLIVSDCDLVTLVQIRDPQLVLSHWGKANTIWDQAAMTNLIKTAKSSVFKCSGK